MKRRWATIALVLALALAAMGAVTASPWVIKAMMGGSWADVGNLGQAYGAASSLLSAAALLGVAASLVMQRRQTRLQNLHALRDRQFQIFSAAWNDPTLMAAITAADSEQAFGDLKQATFVNNYMMYFLTSYESGALSDAELKVALTRMFASPVARAWWGWARELYGSTRSKTTRRLAAIADAALAAATTPAQEESTTESLGDQEGPKENT